MAAIVREIMSPELFSVKPEDASQEVLGYILALEVTGAPVVDEGGRPVGMVSMRDLVGVKQDMPVSSRMTRVPVTVPARAPISEAARLLAEARLHRLIVVDDGGKAVGMVSAVDVICGLTGRPARHPAALAEVDSATGLLWTEWTPLAVHHIEAAPDGPGVFMLQHGAAGERDQVVWAEATGSLRARLLDLCSEPQSMTPALARWLERSELRFRAASVPEVDARRRVVTRLLDESRAYLQAPAQHN